MGFHFYSKLYLNLEIFSEMIKLSVVAGGREVVNTAQAAGLGFLRFQGLADALVPEPSATAK